MITRRVLTLLLALCLLGSLCACRNTGAGNTTDGTTESTTTGSTESTTVPTEPSEATTPTTAPAPEETKPSGPAPTKPNNDKDTSAKPTEPSIKSNVAKPLTWKQINAIPIAKDSMSEGKLRQICLDFMELMIRFAWAPSQQTDLINRGKVVKTLEDHRIYGGIPYVSGRMGNIYTVMEYYDEKTGILDLSGGMATIESFANQCSGSTYWAWNRVCSSAHHTNTADMTEANGCLRVGPYTYPENLTDYLAQNKHTTQICADNGTDTMYESYALLEPADGVVTVHSNNSHVRMISGTPNVVRGPDGKIDGNSSTVTFMDQDGVFHRDTQSNGYSYEYVGGYHVKITFAKLFAEGYLPITFAELNKDTAVAKSKTKLNYTAKTVTVDKLASAVLTCNYSISDVTYVVKDASGKQVYRRLFPTYNIIGIQMHELRLSLYAIDTEELKPFADGKHTIEVSARIGTGEKPVVYTGKLVG